MDVADLIMVSIDDLMAEASELAATTDYAG